jgi:hypothetical protein
MNHSQDHNRIRFINILRQYGITYDSEKYKKLSEFLYNPINSQYLQLYYLLCTGYLEGGDIEAKTIDLISELDFATNGGYTYRQLFDIDKEWYSFFKENAYPLGQRKVMDRRRGVDKVRVDNIMACKRGPPELPLEEAIVKECQNSYGL